MFFSSKKKISKNWPWFIIDMVFLESDTKKIGKMMQIVGGDSCSVQK
jgi:hypothetical protein